SDDSFIADEDSTLSTALSAGDVDGDALTYRVIAGPSHGSLNLTASTGAFSYTPAANYHGTDSFTFRANDGALDSNTATISLTINSVNDAPVAQDGSFATDQDTPFSGSVSATDVDGDRLTYHVITAPAHGHFTFNTGTGAFTYSPANGFSGPDAFTF